MLIENLPSPGFLSNSTTLRREACSAISKAEIQLDLSPESAISEELREFFLACAAACPGTPKPTKKVTK